MTKRPQPVQRAAEFDVAELFFSTTNEKGRITACNEVFTRVAGYEPEEVLGKPHNVVRHPDMPHCVFQLFWTRLLDGEPIGAYVKNMASDGAYYWVFAVAFPVDGGFLSIRLKPTSQMLAKVSKLYAELVALEAEHDRDLTAAMAVSGRRLNEAIEALGFDDYVDFMTTALSVEISARRKHLGSDEGETGFAYGRTQRLARVFRDLETLSELRGAVEKDATALQSVSKSLNRLALNASVNASQLAGDGRALGVLSEEAAVVSHDIAKEADQLAQQQQQLTSVLRDTSFGVSFALLVSEMTDSFESEVQRAHLSEDQQVARFGRTSDQLRATLRQAFGIAVNSSIEGSLGLRGALREFDRIAERFSKILLTTHISHVTGRSIAASVESGEQFARLLDEMLQVAESAREDLDALLSRTTSVDRSVSRWQLAALV